MERISLSSVGSRFHARGWQQKTSSHWISDEFQGLLLVSQNNSKVFFSVLQMKFEAIVGTLSDEYHEKQMISQWRHGICLWLHKVKKERISEWAKGAITRTEVDSSDNLLRADALSNASPARVNQAHYVATLGTCLTHNRHLGTCSASK